MSPPKTRHADPRLITPCVGGSSAYKRAHVACWRATSCEAGWEPRHTVCRGWIPPRNGNIMGTSWENIWKIYGKYGRSHKWRFLIGKLIELNVGCCLEAMVDCQKAMPWFVENTLGFMIGLPVFTCWMGENFHQLIPKAELFVSIWSIFSVSKLRVYYIKASGRILHKRIPRTQLVEPMCCEGPSCQWPWLRIRLRTEVPNLPYISGLFI